MGPVGTQKRKKKHRQKKPASPPQSNPLRDRRSFKSNDKEKEKQIKGEGQRPASAVNRGGRAKRKKGK